MIYITAEKLDIDKPGPGKITLEIDEALLGQVMAALLAGGYGAFYIK